MLFDKQAVDENKNEEINDFLRQKASMGRSDNTLDNYSSVAKKFFHDYFPNLKPEDVEVHHIEEFIRLLDDDYNPDRTGRKSMAASTKKLYLSCLSSFYSWAMKRPKYPEITSNPAGVVAEEIKVNGRSRPDCATWENAKKIVHGIKDPREKTAAVIMAKTGCRVNEALDLTLDDLMLDDGFIRLNDRKGGGETVAPVDFETVKQVEKYKKMRRYPSKNHLFVTEKGNQLVRNQVWKVVRRTAVNQGVMEEGEVRFHRKFTPHTFRTVFTTLMRNQGMSDHVLKYIRGDSDQDMLDHYTRIDREKAREEYLECIKPLKI